MQESIVTMSKGVIPRKLEGVNTSKLSNCLFREKTFSQTVTEKKSDKFTICLKMKRDWSTGIVPDYKVVAAVLVLCFS